MADKVPVPENFKDGDDLPTHDCPIQGPETNLVRAYNDRTKEWYFVCIWCMMADHMIGGKK